MPSLHNSSPDWREARATLTSAVSAHVFPAAVVEVGDRSSACWREAFGHLTYDASAPPCTPGTVFDLASLTKVIVTASAAMRLIDRRALSLDTRLGAVLPEWRGGDRDAVTIRHLLDHSSGLPAHVPLWTSVHDEEDALRAIVEVSLDARPGALSVYSDLGFILLGIALERVAGEPLDRSFASIAETWPQPLLFRPPEPLRKTTAPTELDPWRGRVLQGEVHDENAAAIGGVAGHAGLFGSAEAVGAFARLVLETFRGDTALGPSTLMRIFAAKSAVPGSSRALAWDTMLTTSSCGARMSKDAIGHTGFTGTSLWIDPGNDVYVVLLTNRVHPTRANVAIRDLRPIVHDQIMDTWLKRRPASSGP